MRSLSAASSAPEPEDAASVSEQPSMSEQPPQLPRASAETDRPRLSNRVIESVRPRALPMEEMFSLGPVEKFIRFRIFPFKLLLNVVILALLLAYAFGYHVEKSSYVLNSRFGLVSMFFPANDNTDLSLTQEIGSIQDLVAFLGGVTSAYYAVPDSSVGVYMHYVYGEDDPTPVAPLLRIDLADSFPETGQVATHSLFFNLTLDHPIGPFDNVSAYTHPTTGADCTPAVDARGNRYLPCRNSTLGDFVDAIKFASVELSLRSIRVNPSADIASVVQWKVTFEFTLMYHRSEIRMTSYFENEETQHPLTLPIVVCAILIPLCLWDIILRLRSFHRYHIYATKYLPLWLRFHTDDIDLRHAAQAGASWPIFGLINDLIIIAFCIVGLVNGVLFFASSDLAIAETLLLALSTMFTSFLLLSHLQTAPRFYVLVKALGTALPHLLVYFAGVLPIFLGYAVCGTCVFGGYTSTFSTLPNAMITLFCTMNGDSLLQMFTTIDQTDFFPLRLFSRLFLASFLGLFICNVLNIALAIVQDSYTHVKEVFEVCQFDSVKADEKLAGRQVPSTQNGAAGDDLQSQPTLSRRRPLTRKELRAMMDRIKEALGPNDAASGVF